MDIFELRPLIKNINCKLSAITAYDGLRQQLCLVTDENEIVLRYISATGQEALKMISWFKQTNRVIHDISFDPAGVWLLVLCFDNTLHIVPALYIVDKDDPSSYPLYSTTQITSYIIPFVGPHECPNSKKCPNHSLIGFIQKEKELGQTPGNNDNLEEAAPLENHTSSTAGQHKNESVDGLDVDGLPLGQDLPQHMLATDENENQAHLLDATGNSQVKDTSFMASTTCPYPLSVVWWKTYDGVNRAIIGYSDGSICFVALSPNCPFIASTLINVGSVVNLLICKDNTYDSVMLLITSSMKEQYKLLLEQKAIKFVYPGDISPSALTQSRDSDWQIVMSMQSKNSSTIRKSNSSDPVSDNSPLDEDVFTKNNQSTNVTAAQTLSADTIIASTSLSAVNSTEDNHQITQTQSTINANIGPILANNCNFVAASGANNAALPCSMRFQPQPPATHVFDADGGILPAARARLASLKSLGSKKLQAIKMRLSDNRQRFDEYVPDSSLNNFTIMDSPSVTPETLGNANGSFYTIQNLRSTYLISALHTHSSSLTVHTIDINLKPLFHYKIPRHCLDILISSNILYAIQYVNLNNNESTPSTSDDSSPDETINTEKENRDTDTEKVDQSTGIDSKPKQNESLNNSINAVSVISSAMASLRSGEDDKFNPYAQLDLFRFENETVLNLYQMATYHNDNLSNEQLTKEDKIKAFELKDIHTPMDYVQFYVSTNSQTEYSLHQMEVMKNEFPKINYDPCYIVTNKNIYYIQMRKEPFEIFLEAAIVSDWQKCRDFCNTFDLCYETCVEFAGDYFLRRKKITQALLTYNIARVKPIRTALKLAMFGHTYALMQLCAMALKSTYILRSRYLCHPILKTLLKDITLRHSEDVRSILTQTDSTLNKEMVNEGADCSDYKYGVDESISALQMSPSSQFHLANLLIITLAEKAVNDKQYVPLWNFLTTNSKYHTNMTSIVLCQSGLFSSAIILAKVRGVCVDTFLALTSVVAQEFGWYSEMNVCLYNLSDSLFVETITYLPHISVDYFNFIQEKIDLIRPCVLNRLAYQLNPFSAALRPIVSHTSTTVQRQTVQNSNDDNNNLIFDFCKNLIETYLAVLIHIESQYVKRDSITNALSNFRITYEDNQFAIDTTRFKLISAGCAHCACVVDGVAYFWGSNGVPCCYSGNKPSDPPEPPHAVKSLDFLSQLNLEVHAVKCGRQHTLLLTNNGLYAMGNNNLCQLGIGKHMLMAVQPMLVRALDGKNITILEAGQYHNAVVADNQLYAWGWGAYGQLGRGDCENVAEPQIVNFFKYKKVLQISLGHAHSLVLCQASNSNEATNTELYVFGSNNFGQLGLGDSTSTDDSIDALHCSSIVKSILPIKLEIGTSNIRLIHTKFFTNLAVDTDEHLYTWGSSPQALRLANQIRRRANAKQKLEENQQREMSKRLEPTLSCSNDNDNRTSSTVTQPATSYASVAASAVQNSTRQDALEKENETKDNETEKIDVKDKCDAFKIEPAEDLDSFINENSENNIETKKSTSNTQKTKFSQAASIIDADPCEHMKPHLVDTSEVAGNILQISSGLFHFALISSSCTLYTWGKNLEHQLGTEDKERRPVAKPSPIDSIDWPMYVDCGADFTLVMTVDYVVKAFGGNSNGQCGRDLGVSIDRMKQRVVCLPTTKRLMRFESQCMETPVEINLPRPSIKLNNEPVRYLKSIPRYQPHFFQEAAISFERTSYNPPSTASPHYKSSSENAATAQDSDDLISSLDNLSNNDASSLNCSYNAPPLIDINSSFDCTPEEQSYAPLAQLNHNAKYDVAGRLNDNDDNDPSTFTPTGTDEDAVAIESLRHYTHYCLYAFQGLYNPNKVNIFSKQRNEYRIRTLMLNFKYVDAFKLCLQDCDNAQRTLKVFEYFSKDTGYVPVRRHDNKFLIYHMCLHFILNKFEMHECESYFLTDLDYYLMELGYVLYFNNNNSVLEQNLNQKFKNLLAQEQANINIISTDSNQEQNNVIPESSAYKLQDTDAIFDSLSVKFKTIVCQQLLKYCAGN